MKIRQALLLPIITLFSGNSCALDWLFEPTFRVTERYTDNLRMQPNPTRDDFITTISPGVMFGYLADNNELQTSFHWNELIYHSDSNLDFSEKILDLNHQFRAERFKTNLTAQFAEQSSINTQLDLDGSGDLQTLVPRTTYSIMPSVTYSLTEKTSVQLGYSYLQVDFTQNPNLRNNLGFSDYTNQQFSANFIHAFNERLQFNFTAAYSEFDSSNTSSAPIGSSETPIDILFITDFSQRSTNMLYQLGMQYAIDEKTILSLSAGLRDTESKSSFIQSIPRLGPSPLQKLSQSSSTLGHVFEADLTRNDEWGEVTLNAGQQLNPSSAGSQRESTTFMAKGRYNINERLTTGITASYLMSDSVSTFRNSSLKFKRTYTSITPNIRWRWTPQVSVELSYSYRQQDYDSLDRSATSNNVMLQFSFQPQINRLVK